MKIIADLEVHSKYARAVSPQMSIPTIAEWAVKKGIDLVGSGDFTHPLWEKELETNLEEAEEGIYKLKGSKSSLPARAGEPAQAGLRFLLTSEISCIYSHKNKVRRVHILVYLPSLSLVRKFNSELLQHGANLFSDGRPIVGMSLSNIAEIALSVSRRAILIPAHVWTPWFGFYGSFGGYDSLEEAFGSLSHQITAIETGLSSDPAMNWRIGELDSRSIVSFGDAHSPQKLGREATVFDISEINYTNIRKALSRDNTEKIAYTIEFYPEEGKYHYTGHRGCKVVHSPKETRKLGTICPVCGKGLTVGVLARVEHLATKNVETLSKIDSNGVRWILPKSEKRPPFVMLVPLMEIISEAISMGVTSRRVNAIYETLTDTFKGEFNVLLKTAITDIEKLAGLKVAEGIKKVRFGDIVIDPGYDGVFGKVKIWKEEQKEDTSVSQTTLF